MLHRSNHIPFILYETPYNPPQDLCLQKYPVTEHQCWHNADQSCYIRHDVEAFLCLRLRHQRSQDCRQGNHTCTLLGSGHTQSKATSKTDYP
jgi:hypothetical protein